MLFCLLEHVLEMRTIRTRKGKRVSFILFHFVNILRTNYNNYPYFAAVFLKFIQPSIEVLSVRIDEPITTMTDLIMAAICFYAYYRIRQQESSVRIKGYFKYYFLTLGLATVAGGIIGSCIFIFTLSFMETGFVDIYPHICGYSFTWTYCIVQTTS